MVDTPVIHSEGTTNPTWHIDQIHIKPEEYDAELLKLTVFGASGSFKLFYYSPDKTETYIAEIDIGESADDVKNALRWNLPNMNYGPAVTRE